MSFSYINNTGRAYRDTEHIWQASFNVADGKFETIAFTAGSVTEKEAISRVEKYISENGYKGVPKMLTNIEIKYGTMHLVCSESRYKLIISDDSIITSYY